MAVIVYFSKISEDERSIRYSFGPGPGQMARVLTFDKTTGQPTPQDDRRDHAFLAAARKITAALQDRETWPERGMHVS